MRVAAIDVGSNSIHLMVGERDVGGYRVLDDEKIVTRLGQGLEPGGELHRDKILEAAEAVHRLRAIALGYGVDEIRMIATAAMRDATNAQELIDLISQHDGAELEVIGIEREASLAFRSATRAFDLSESRVAVCDVGGASTEIVLATDGVVDDVRSVPIGAVRLTDRFGACEQSDSQYRKLRDGVRDAFRETIDRPAFAPSLMIGIGGTFTSLGRMALAARLGLDTGEALDRPVRGLEILHDEVRHLIDELRRMSVTERGSVPGINPQRADIIVSGLEIIDRAMRRLGVNKLRVHDRGIRDGLILEMLEGEQAPTQRVSRVDSARKFAERCRIDGPQSESVAKVATQLFDQLRELQPGAWAEAPNRELLEAAALVHNVGYLVGYSKHHKHSYHLIVHAGMPGFTRRETEIVAQIARYHRRAKPKLSHTAFASLVEADREIVMKLGGILRIADGLNRTHRETVTHVKLHQLDQGSIRFDLFGDESGISVWGAERKRDLFEQAFGVHCLFELAGPADAATPEGTQP